MIRPRRGTLSAAAARLAGWVDPLTARVREPELAWLGSSEVAHATLPRVAAIVVGSARASIEARHRVEIGADSLRAAASVAEGEGLEQVLARHVRATVEGIFDRWGDLRALRRDLDLDALLEREAAHTELHGARLEVALRVLGGLTTEALAVDAFEETGAHALLCDVATAEPRRPTRRAAVSSLAAALSSLLSRGEVPEPRGLQVLQRIARNPQDDPWCRRAALGVARGLEPRIAERWIAHALDDTVSHEAWLIRAKAIALVLDGAGTDSFAMQVATRHLDDPAELVRFELAAGLGRRWSKGDDDAGKLLVRMMAEHPSPRTRAKAVVAGGARAVGALAGRLTDDRLVATYALDVLHRANDVSWPREVISALDHVAVHSAPGLARSAALALSRRRLRPPGIDELARSLAELRPGATASITLPPGSDPIDLAEALLPAAADGHGFSLEPKGRSVRVVRGDVLRPRLWRVLHELRNPGPTKRQSISHVLGRADTGEIRVPPCKLAEESATGVPGERIRVAREDGWSPGLPGVDAYLHALGRDRVTIVAPEGITTVEPPVAFRQRARAWWRTTIAYGAYDELRTACVTENDSALRGRYVAAFAALGYRTVSTALRGGPFSGYYAAALLDPVAYLLSLRSNTLAHLALLVGLLALVLLGRNGSVQSIVRRARREVPLVIGGWGTRGKSGTERLKAGMLEGLGIPLLSKTTGCEAMVLHGPPGGHALELFLFRPYDRATIWEQVDVVRLGPRLGARTVLWECMALNPIYVDLLQTRWMRDDLSTLTNAYPDHEDVMGPSGMDVARAIAGFSPRDATVITTEDNMLAELRHVGEGRGANVVQVPRVDRELVASELLDRMPHVEHPANVALVAAVGAELGVDRTEAIGMMGEHVVPDLGALSVTPEARHMGRLVTFTNGMSANDTLSFRHNWRRAGFLDHDHRADPATWLVTVINNRADRVARSRVFAQVCAEDAAAHRQVLIGTNTQGFMTYLDDAVERRLQAVVLGTPEKVDALFAHLRIVDPARLGEACAERLGTAADARGAWVAAVGALCDGPASWTGAQSHAEAVRPAAAALEAACPSDGAGLADALVGAVARWVAARAARSASEAEVRALYADLVRASFVVISDSGSTGDQTMAKAIASCPPGAIVRIMGIQNIKGTGLDFAYQWVFWRELHKGLVDLASDHADRRKRGIEVVEANPFGSALACDEALATLAGVQADPAIGPRARRLIDRIGRKRREHFAARGRAAAKQGWGAKALSWIESVLDPFDAIWRRRRARQVFRDLCDRRISHPRAQAWLQYLTKRQKGGWLGKGRHLH